MVTMQPLAHAQLQIWTLQTIKVPCLVEHYPILDFRFCLKSTKCTSLLLLLTSDYKTDLISFISISLRFDPKASNYIIMLEKFVYLF